MKANRGSRGQGPGPPFNLGAHLSLQLTGVRQLTGKVPLIEEVGGAEVMITLIIYTNTWGCDVRGRQGTVGPPDQHGALAFT